MNSSPDTGNLSLPTRGRPRLTQVELDALLAPFALDRARYPLIIVGIRGYYRDSMGAPGKNDRAIYDDGLFVESPRVMAAFNGNTDPSKYRAGSGSGAKKGMASLKAGAWFVHKFDLHKGKYLALCQRGGEVTVLRDGPGGGSYEDKGNFGINIHKGGFKTTSSEGCQTIHPSQWDEFIQLAVSQAKWYFKDAWKKSIIPYILFDGMPP